MPSKTTLTVPQTTTMLRFRLITPLKTQIRLHSTGPVARPIINKFPQLSEITAKDIGYSTESESQFGRDGYHLERSKHNKLPVYIEYKGGNVAYTEIRKIKGDIVLLRNDLQEILHDVPKKHFKILIESKKILIQGNHKERLVDVLQHVF